MSVAVRFAPSPTGLLHVGNVRAALVNWLFARNRAGSFMLRLDDTDRERSKPEFAAAIERDLAWLGLTWGRFARQSDRLSRYAETAERLKGDGRLYDCYETPDELERKRALARASHRPPVYDRAALKLNADDKRSLVAAGRKPHWRFKLDHAPVVWDDIIRGRVEIDPASASDPVLVREDGTPLYGFCSVVDDIDFSISHIVRGEDHVTNTAAQIQLFRALGAAPPAFAHFALLVNAAGEGLSKRSGSLSLADLREQGIEPMAVASLIARLGTSDPVEPKQTLDDLAAGYALEHFGRGAAHFDPAELVQLSRRVLHGMSYATAKPRLAALGLGAAGEDFWLAVRGNLDRFEDARDWWQVVAGTVAPVCEDAELLGVAGELLPGGPFDGATWGAWTKAVSQKSGRKGRALFHPLRLALTGRERGPEMLNLLPLIGPERARARLRGETA
ncbi:MAG TPA: glutamate--tRNA ligase [Candidatus Cybelea sp.]|nr:glutamate--tRNA ligase [Candidatus Cybelea sp.]